MIKIGQIDTIVQRLLDSLPPGLVSLPQDVEKNIRQSLSNTLAKMDLVTREEFDAQTKVLARTRKKLAQLQQKVDELENPKN